MTRAPTSSLKTIDMLATFSMFPQNMSDTCPLWSSSTNQCHCQMCNLTDVFLWQLHKQPEIMGQMPFTCIWLLLMASMELPEEHIRQITHLAMVSIGT